ncbi:SDR family oxidoreductase [soil metagenome]
MRILITGAARGIGRAIADRLSRDHDGNGLKLLLVDQHAQELDDYARVLAPRCEVIATATGDLTQPQFCADVAALAVEKLGGMDVFVSNAGGSIHGALKELPLEAWNLIIELNCTATWLLAKGLYEPLKEAGGCIVVISSIAGTHPEAKLGSYSVSKAAVTMLAQQLAIEWGPDGIRTNIISPGTIHTSNTDRVYRNPEAKADRERVVPVRRIGTPDDIAGTVSFLAGPDGRYCNGANFVIDGGFTQTVMSQLRYVAKT